MSSRRFLYSTTLLLYNLLLTVSLSAASDSQPQPLVPYGGYLANVNFTNTQFVNIDFSSFYSIDKINTFQWTSDSPANATACWCLGYSIYLSGYNQFGCDTRTVSQPQEFRESIYSQPLMQGSYTDSCLYPIPLRQGNRLYIKSLCGEQNGLSPQIHDITNCTAGTLYTNNHREITCNDLGRIPRQIVTGSFISSCIITTLQYTPKKNGSLSVVCSTTTTLPRTSLQVKLNDVQNCLNSHNDIVWIEENRTLACEANSSQTIATLHTESDLTPPGEYLLTCSHTVFYPDAGNNNSGLLVARCRCHISDNYALTSLHGVSLIDDDDPDKEFRRENKLFCRNCVSHQLGRIIESYGYLRCQPYNSNQPAIRTNIREFCQGYEVPGSSYPKPDLNQLNYYKPPIIITEPTIQSTTQSMTDSSSTNGASQISAEVPLLLLASLVWIFYW